MPLSSRSLTVFALGLAVLVAGCDRQTTGEAQASASAAPVPQGAVDRGHKGEAPPALSIKDQTGRTLQLASLAGKPTLVNLWATWCAPCIAELPQLDAIAAAGRIRVLTVSQDMQGTEKVAGFLAQKGGAHLEPWLDPKNDLAFRYDAGTLPTTILYDAAGKEVWRYVGGQDWTSAPARALLAEAS